MKLFRFRILLHSLAGITLLALPLHATFAQGANAANVLNQMSAAFSGGKIVQNVQLSGNAIWHTGNLEDSGAATLTASSDGSSLMQLVLASAGQRAEIQTGSGLDATCQWAGADGVSHAINSVSCGRPVIWFMPTLSLQPSLLPSDLGVADLGMGTVGAVANTCRHLQSQLTLSGSPDPVSTDIAQMSKTDIGIAPNSLLPEVLVYSARPDGGAAIAIAVEVHFSDYRTVAGVQIPFLIQRYVNGSLQLELHLSSAEIN